MKPAKTLILALLAACLSLGYAGCGEDDDDDSSGSGSAVDNNKCTGSCAYCEYKPGMWCTGTTTDSGETWCWYCYDAQTCNAQLGICQ